MKNTIILLAVFLFCISCSSEDEPEKRDIQIVIDTDHVTMKIGEYYELPYKIINNTIDKSTISVYVDNSEIARAYSDDFDNMVGITGLEPGETELVIGYMDIEKRVKITVRNEYDPEAYLQKFFRGFRAKDTTDLKIIYFGGDVSIAYLFGTRGDKFWIGKFDTPSKEQLAEYKTNKPVVLNRRVHLGFGEYREMSFDEFFIESFFETKTGWVAEISLDDSRYSMADRYHIFLFNENNDTKEYFFNDVKNLSTEHLIKWYDDSFLRRINVNDDKDTDTYTCFKSNGEIILSGKSRMAFPKERYDGMSFPVTYDKYIMIKPYDSYYKEYKLDISINSITGAFPSINAEFADSSEAFRFTCEQISITNSVQTFKVNFTYESGRKESRVYEVNVADNVINEKIIN